MALLPERSVREYRRQLEDEKESRRRRYTLHPGPGLFSVLTPIWNGSPPRYLRALANSLADQNAHGVCQWVLLDNGCRNEPLLRLLNDLAKWPWVKLVRSETNLGIIGGLRRCLEEASGRYVLPVDGDDLLDDDTLRVLASAVEAAGYPPLLYTDEDKILGRRRYEPYRKPAWDPVLLLNSAYIAHLGVIDREIAIALGAYSDPAAEGSPDWDVFVRFLLAGYHAVHIPEVVYSWRAHAASTADDSANKAYIASSQRAVLRRFLDNTPKGKLFDLSPSSLWQGGAHWHFARKQERSRPGVRLFSRTAGLPAIHAAALAMAEQAGMVLFTDDDLRVSDQNWPWEAQGILELHADTVLVGGRIWNRQNRIVEAGFTLDDSGRLSNPHRGKAVSDFGYFGQMWKQRTVDAVSTQLAAVDGTFLLASLERLPAQASAPALGFWLSAFARRSGRRVVYSPFVAGISEIDAEGLLSAKERQLLESHVAGSNSTASQPRP